MNKRKKGFVVVAEKNNKIIGYLCGGLMKISWRNVKIAELENMFVLPKYQNRGIGTKLVNAFFEWCNKRKCDVVRVGAFHKNKRAIRFYEKFGFEKYELTLEKKSYLI